MPRLVGPPYTWKTVYEDVDTKVVHAVNGPWAGIFWAGDRTVPQWNAKAETLASALISLEVVRRGYSITIQRTKSPRRKAHETHDGNHALQPRVVLDGAPESVADRCGSPLAVPDRAAPAGHDEGAARSDDGGRREDPGTGGGPR